ncbi:FtsX-like permease family protein [Ekhidna sp.]|uniref:FtsX-like permease family protein n=1 Tax=Ekhidna sp. TaxID=2608089 RepID=UPI003CCB92B5
MSNVTPPKWPGKFLRLFINKDYLEEIEGDLEEVFYDDAEYLSLKEARLNYTLGVFKLFRLSLIKNLKWIYKIGLIATTMRTIRLAFRNLLKFKTHSAINLIGLSLGLSIGGLILLYVMDELSFDNFHTKGDRIYKVVTASPEGGMETNAHPIGYKLRTEYPEVESVLYTRWTSSDFKVNHEGKRYDHKVFFASEEFFHMFSFPLASGDAKTALEDPYTIVITESLEDVYFEGSALGQTITMMDSIDFMITGVVKDLPRNSHIQFDILISFSTFPDFRYFSYNEGWGNFDVRNYLLLKEGIDSKVFQSKVNSLYDENIGDWLDEMGVEFTTKLIPLKDIYLNEDYYNGFGPNGSIKRVKTVTIIALFLILLASINYINLSTARSSYRSKEVAVKKIVGSSRRGILSQFMLESFLLTLIAFGVALMVIALVLPFFNELMLKDYTLQSFASTQFIIGIAALILIVTFLSGYYPALVISGLKPLNALNGKLEKAYSGISIRKLLITFQFFISSALVLATILVIDQISFMRNQELGFDKEQLLIIDATDAPTNSSRVVLKNQLKALPGVQFVTHTNALPGRPGWQGQWAYPGKMEGEQVDTEYMAIDENYVQALGLNLIAGENFDPRKTSELDEGLIINETCVREMGWNSPEDAIGKKIVSPSGTPEGTVIGVVKDYHGLGLQENIWPKAMDYAGDKWGRYYAIRYSADQTYDLIKSVEKTWNKTYASYPLEYFFLDQDFDRQYREESQLAQVLSIFTVVVIIVSAIGLLGLISFVALSRTKEVGIRKTMGASIGQIIYILSKEFIYLVILGNLLAIPLIWYYGNLWLNDFAYHTSINPLNFVIAIIITAIIAFLTVSIQTYKTAKMNPVNALRYE